MVSLGNTQAADVKVGEIVLGFRLTVFRGQPDDSLAFSWFQKAALQGHSGARIMLGSMLAAGRGTHQDLHSAYLWLSAASLQGDPRGESTLQFLEHRLTAAQIAEAKEQARSLMPANPQSPALAHLQ